MRAFLVTGGIFAFTHLIELLGWTEQVELLFHFEETGTFSAIREVMLLLMLVQLADWVFLPKVSLTGLIRNEESLPVEIRAAMIRGWMTFIAALCVAVALVQYT